MEFMYALGTILLVVMLFNCRADIRKNQLSLERIEQSAERIAQMATEVSTKTDEILRRSN